MQLRAFSLTGNKNGDATKAELLQLHECLKKLPVVKKYVFSIERGPVIGNLHYQGVMVLVCKSGNHVKAMLNDACHWGKKFNDSAEPDFGSNWRAKALTGDGLHTLIGMIGYCLKDEDLAHFATVDFNVTEDEKAKGRDTHMCEGQGHLKKRQSLTQVSSVYVTVVFYLNSLTIPSSAGQPDLQGAPVLALCYGM
jgi:hypothetical protein